MGAVDVVMRCCGGIVAYIGLGLAWTPLFLWLDRRAGYSKIGLDLRARYVLTWPLFAMAAAAIVGLPAVFRSFGRLSLWMFPDEAGPGRAR
jgi:hypothetical protein